MRIGKRIMAKAFVIIIGMDFFVSNILAVLERYRGFSANFTGLVKIFMIIETFFCIFYSLFVVKRINIINPLSVMFIVAIPIGIIVGLCNNQFDNREFVSHIYEFVMPIFAMGVGGYLKDAIYSDKELLQQLSDVMKCGGYFFVVGVFLFRVMYIGGMANYNAYGAATCDYVLPYLLFMTNNTRLAYIVAFAGVVGGKRAVLVKVFVILFMYYCYSGRNASKKIKDILYAAIGGMAVYIVSIKTNFFNRVVLVMTHIQGDAADIDLATGGRSSEIAEVVSYLNEKTGSWLWGSGFGARISLSDGLTRHYSHFTPLAYVVSAGIFFSILLYSVWLVSMVKLFFLREAKYKLLACYLGTIVVGSLFGATLINEPKMWIIIGMTVGLLQKREVSLSIRKK